MPKNFLRKKRECKTRKLSYPVFLTYGPPHGSPLKWIERWREDIICVYQRLRYGYCYRDVWSIDWWFVTVIPNMIHDLRINGHGYPGDFTGTEKDKEQEKIKGYHRVYTMSDVLEYKEISDQWLTAENELTDYRNRCMKEGMKLFTRYFWNLWD